MPQIAGRLTLCLGQHTGSRDHGHDRRVDLFGFSLRGLMPAFAVDVCTSVRQASAC